MKTAAISVSPGDARNSGPSRSFAWTPLRLKLAAGLAIVVIWEIVVLLFAPFYVARPTGIVAAFPQVIVDPEFLSAAGATLKGVGQGLVIAVISGVLVGVAMGRIRVVEYGLRYYINGLFAVPMVAVLPLLSLWFSYSADARLALVVFATFFPIVINVADGARSVPTHYLEVARMFRAGRVRVLFDVILPASVPYLLAGLRLAAGRALTAAIVAEFFFAIPGLGYHILYDSRSFQHNQAFIGVILLGLTGVGFEAALNLCSRYFLPWFRRG